MSIVIINNLTKYYGKIKALENISLEINEGEIFGVLGPKGSGKSTLIDTMIALQKPTSGSVEIFGLDINKDRKKIYRNIGYLPAEFTYRGNAKVGSVLKDAATLYKENCDERIVYFAEKLYLDLKQRISDLSASELKKVAIVRALAHQPRLLLLNEPTKGLNLHDQKILFALLKEENRNGVTIILSSARISDAQKICNRLAYLSKGRLLGIEETSALYNNSYYKIKFSTTVDINIGHFNLPGVIDFNIEELEAGFLYHGPLNAILNVLNAYPLLKIIIEEPPLQDIYLHYF